jgi:hypothetical protein
MDSMSGRLGNACGHLLDPAIDDPPGVVRPGAGFGVELDGSGAPLGEVEALDRPVVERDVRRLTRLAGSDGEAVVLARDEDAARGALDDRVIRAAVAERELVGPVASREREQLVAEADPEDRDTSD